ncbi:MAG: hypothetical protein R2932_30780 [Caldilineaceae bacterium]
MSKNTTQCATDRTVQLTVENVSLVGDLACRLPPEDFVLFAMAAVTLLQHTQSRYVAALLNEGGLATRCSWICSPPRGRDRSGYPPVAL